MWNVNICRVFYNKQSTIINALPIVTSGGKTKFINNVRLLIISIFLDLIDYFGLPMLPIIGDVIDIFGTMVFYFISKNKASTLVTLVELIPMADILPTYTIATIMLMVSGGWDVF